MASGASADRVQVTSAAVDGGASGRGRGAEAWGSHVGPLASAAVDGSLAASGRGRAAEPTSAAVDGSLPASGRGRAAELTSAAVDGGVPGSGCGRPSEPWERLVPDGWDLAAGTHHAMEALTQILRQVFPATGGEPPARDLDFVEAFAGGAAISKGLELLGFVGVPFDQVYSDAHDILEPTGFALLASLVARLRPGGIFWAAPPCHSWVFMGLPNHGRAISPGGEPRSFATVSQNALVLRLLTLSAFARSRGVFFLWEQPSSTRMFRWRPVRRFAEACPDIRDIRLEMGCFGLLAEKETILWGNAPWMAKLAIKLSSPDRQHLRARPDRVLTSHRWVDASGRLRCQGSGALQSTQEYPKGFGAAHALAFQEWTSSVALPGGCWPPPPLPEPWFLADLEAGSSHRWHNDKAKYRGLSGGASSRSRVRSRSRP